MSKLRSDSVFCQLTTEQVETLDGWLFEERLGYKEITEKLKGEFGLETSMSGVRRFYQRLAMERSREDMVDLLSTSKEVAEAIKTGTLQSGILALGNKCALELLIESPKSVREFTALLRTLISAQGMEMKRVEFQREENQIQRALEDQAREEQLKKEQIEKWNRDEEILRQMREQKRRAKLAAQEASKAAKPEGGVKVESGGTKSGGDDASAPVTTAIPACSPEGGGGVEKTGSAPLVAA